MHTAWTHTLWRLNISFLHSAVIQMLSYQWFNAWGTSTLQGGCAMRSLSTGPRLSLALRELSIRQAHEAFYSGSQAISEAAMHGTGGEKTSAMPEGPQSKSCKWHIRIQRPASTNMQSLVQNSQHVMTMQPIKRHVLTRGAKNTPLHPFPDRETSIGHYMLGKNIWRTFL